MHSLRRFLLVLFASAPVLSAPSAQGGTQTFAPPLDCVMLIPVEIPGQMQAYVKLRFGDEIVSGCLGQRQQCYIAIYVPC
jgi:hypothetical protein